MNSRRSSSASSISSGTGQVMPITLARQTYSPTVVFPIPSDCAINRSLIPSACLNRSTSRTLRIDNLSAGIRRPLRLLQRPDHAIRSPTDSPPYTTSAVAAFNWNPARLPLESVAALRWNTHSCGLDD